MPIQAEIDKAITVGVVEFDNEKSRYVAITALDDLYLKVFY